MTDHPRIITGKVSEWIAVLRDMVAEFGAHTACLVLQSGDKSIEEHAVRSVEVDDDGQEVNLCAEPLESEPLSVAAVLLELEHLPAEQGSFSLYSASPRRTLPDDIDVRVDAPIVTIMVDPAGKRLGFVGPGVEGDVPHN